MRKMDGVLSDGAGAGWAGSFGLPAVGPLGLPATFAVTQIAMPTRFSLPAWTLAVVAGLTSLAPLWDWLRGRNRLTLGLAATTVCGQLVVLMLWFCPRLPRGFPAAIWPTIQSHARIALEAAAGPGAGRLGPLLSRSRLAQPVAPRPDNEPGYRRPPASPPMDTKEWIVIPERHLHTALNHYDLSSLPYQRAGRFRLIGATT